MKKYLDLVLNGEEFDFAIDDYIDKWHDLPCAPEPLHDYLGMTLDEYNLWVENSDSLSQILYRRTMKSDMPVSDLKEMHLMAARSTSKHDPSVLTEWLKAGGYID
ncbi:hypothetical protein ACWPKO_10180 [Coraliomargarita sp. W4R53]